MISDADLIALAAVVDAEVAEALVANASRAHRGYAPAYGEDWTPSHLVDLLAALKLRGVIAREGM